MFLFLICLVVMSSIPLDYPSDIFEGCEGQGFKQGSGEGGNQTGDQGTFKSPTGKEFI
jgi:hypothetical protein